MAVPKFRISKSKTLMRRSHHALKAPGASLCPNCGEVRRPHTVCGACGHFKGKQVIAPKTVSTTWEGEGFENPQS